MYKKFKILHTEWSDGWGGQEIRIINESLALKEKYGVEIFIACRSHAKISQKAKQAGLQVAHFDFNSSYDIKTIFQLIKFIKNNKIDILNSHSGKDSWVGGLAAKIAGIKFIRTRHLSNKINSSRLNFINSLADFIITTGESVKEAMIKENRIDKDQILSIPTGIDEKKFDATIYDKDECLQKFGLEKGKIYVGMLSVLRAFKRHDVFLQIALNLHDKFKDVVFVIAGDGPKKDDIKAFIKEHHMDEYVKMIGHCDEPANFLHALDIFMLISDSGEGVPQSLMQALLMNKACIATDVGSIKDLYDGSNFSLVNFDKNEIEIALIKMLQNDEQRNKFEKNAREFVKNNFTKDIMANKIYKIYEDLAG
ncbi:glycosyltransferase [Campylobacter sp. CCUG 57310]|uniref:glycosyltransferase n=1 Tax=Campylobacter sp. CCUG 57310 TaxID=2517362 RepID=UPI0015631392|nr:glycosyltransferase [Campylobacter sp. CCUG 57310]QKF91696.1 glycosyltransferase, family 1 [Campylobacter sp. CCUG 57310]